MVQAAAKPLPGTLNELAFIYWPCGTLCSTAHACVSSNWHRVRATSGWQMAMVIDDNSGPAAESVCMADCCIYCMQPSQGSTAMPLIASVASADGQAGTNTAAVGSWAGAE